MNRPKALFEENHRFGGNLNHKIEGEQVKETVISFLLFCAIVFAILIGKGTLFSGFHYVDDHEFAEMEFLLKDQHWSIPKTIGSWLAYDFTRRFRPLYYILRVLTVAVFGIDTIAISVCRGFIAASTMTVLYHLGRRTGNGRFLSFLFSFISIIGYQMAAVWKMGPQENFGTLLLALTLLFLLRYLDWYRISDLILTLVLATCMSLYKESYIMTVPFLVCLTIYRGRPESIGFSKALTTEHKTGRRILCASLTVLFITMLVLIWAVVYNRNVSASSDISIVNGVIHSVTTDLRWYALFSLLLLFIFFSFWDRARAYWREGLLFLSFILPQMVLYIRDMTERYILPWAVGYAAIFVLFIPHRVLSHGRREKLYYILLIGLLLANLRGALVEADYFRFSGKSLTTAMETVEEISKEHGGDDSIRIMTCFSPDEEGNLMIKYWLRLHGVDNVWYWHQDAKTINQAFNYDSYGYLSGYREQSTDLDSIDVIVTANRRDRHFLFDPDLDLTDFTKVPCGSMTLYIRNSTCIDIPAIEEPVARYY
ncbi:MAG: hypothetical protein LKH04_08240 [Lachnospiraceae bacterium]|jgi:hypothetical protein|nr:hypothetical protein [Lachnospiraceae bacterium]MCI1424266.1 hypothetical protein [Lachnospiraceae bacterium]MCI1451868.1 hypothetical protein [Lachnospiraceae bacterium]